MVYVINRFSEWGMNLKPAFGSVLLLRLICVDNICIHPTENRSLSPCSVVKPSPASPLLSPLDWALVCMSHTTSNGT